MNLKIKILTSILSTLPNSAPSVIATISVGNEPRGISANPTTNRIYVANHRDSTVSVIE